MVKCAKCGAEIPGEAGFCPGCGAPKPAEQPAPQPMQPVPKASGGDGLHGIADTVFSKVMIMLGICIGLLLAWIGKILTVFTSGTAYSVGNVLVFTGLAGMGFVLLGGGFLNKGIDKYIRLGMIITGGLTIVFALSLTFSFSMPDYSSLFSGFSY
jgi:hypothetical protein